ncbi:hypothetical protein BCV70DRAFT_1861 [Testicularia cyperi]|uniref:Uncharacterized protein n=1 Tax=Testicularia cyperi TaxID=1882483 RepID=A0A317XYW7_9BASI|nr:hypothetical protein BCV70DRAFT_1861 [Testicularia cyperi]
MLKMLKMLKCSNARCVLFDSERGRERERERERKRGRIANNGTTVMSVAWSEAGMNVEGEVDLVSFSVCVCVCVGVGVGVKHTLGSGSGLQSTEYKGLQRVGGGSGIGIGVVEWCCRVVVVSVRPFFVHPAATAST